MKDAQLGALDTVRCANFLNNDLPDGCADLIVADPPYFEVKGDFDFQWPTFRRLFVRCGTMGGGVCASACPHRQFDLVGIGGAHRLFANYP